MTEHFDTYQGAQLLGVAPATVRSWIKRGHLPRGRFRGGKLTWTERQLSQAKAAARTESVAPQNGNAWCSRGHEATSRRGDDDSLIVDCEFCEIAIAVPVASFAPHVKPYLHRNLDVQETSIDPSENGAAFRRRAMQLYLERHVHGPQVYFIRLGPYVKIGTSVDVPRRISALSLQLGHLMATIDGGQAEERQTHNRFAHLNAFGEWFYLRDDLLAFAINRQREQIEHVLNDIAT